MNYKQVLKEIQPLDTDAKLKAGARLDSLIKPIGSLGKLEDIARQISGITGEIINKVDKKCTVIMAADNGVVEEGVSTAPKEITAMQTINILNGLAGISVLSKQAKAEIRVIDIGVDGELSHKNLISKKVKKGTGNIAMGPAMTTEEAIKAIEIGIDIIKELHTEGYNLIGTGEMGIGNTTTSSAVLMCLTGADANRSVGKGAGMSDDALEHKKRVIERAINLNNPNKNDPIDVVAKVGGLDIAGLVGCYIGAAYYRIPIVIDGVISAAAALLAYRLNPITKDYMIPSHYSEEPAFKHIMESMNLEPNLHLNMRLGEGTGCPLMFHIIESALAVISEMATFDQLQMDNDFLVDIR